MIKSDEVKVVFISPLGAKWTTIVSAEDATTVQNHLIEHGYEIKLFLAGSKMLRTHAGSERDLSKTPEIKSGREIEL